MKKYYLLTLILYFPAYAMENYESNNYMLFEASLENYQQDKNPGNLQQLKDAYKLLETNEQQMAFVALESVNVNIDLESADIDLSAPVSHKYEDFSEALEEFNDCEQHRNTPDETLKARFRIVLDKFDELTDVHEKSSATEFIQGILHHSSKITLADSVYTEWLQEKIQFKKAYQEDLKIRIERAQQQQSEQEKKSRTSKELYDNLLPENVKLKVEEQELRSVLKTLTEQLEATRNSTGTSSFEAIEQEQKKLQDEKLLEEHELLELKRQKDLINAAILAKEKTKRNAKTNPKNAALEAKAKAEARAKAELEARKAEAAKRAALRGKK